MGAPAGPRGAPNLNKRRPGGLPTAGREFATSAVLAVFHEVKEVTRKVFHNRRLSKKHCPIKARKRGSEAVLSANEEVDDDRQQWKPVESSSLKAVDVDGST